MGILFKILIFIFLIIYVIRKLIPFLFSWLIREITKKTSSGNFSYSNQNKKQEKTSNSEKLGEYVDYEEID
ncbi:MAG: hypothetical protein CMC81_05990 [Flavobacteriaceae bacterium]|nr:hypothetical protein [Flavobacteriaceae bacterium]